MENFADIVVEVDDSKLLDMSEETCRRCCCCRRRTLRSDPDAVVALKAARLEITAKVKQVDSPVCHVNCVGRCNQWVAWWCHPLAIFLCCMAYLIFGWPTTE